MGSPYEDMSLEDLQLAVDEYNRQIAGLKEEVRQIIPYLSAKQKEFNDAEAAKGDPRLTQGISLN